MTTHTPRPLADFAFEVGRLRHVKRYLAFQDAAPSVAEHTFRITMLAWLIAEREGANVGETLKMALAHDVAEVRTRDHDAMSKVYNTVNENQAIEDIFGDVLPSAKEACAKYHAKQTLESKIVKDVDNLDILLEIKEMKYAGKSFPAEFDEVYLSHRQTFFTQTARDIFDEAIGSEPLDFAKTVLGNYVANLKNKTMSTPKVA